MPIPRHRLILFLGLAGLALAGCTYSGGIDNPLVRKFEWFSYVAGDDIRSKCGPGSPPQYRLVYNANWDEQVRAYDLRQSFAQDGGAMLFTQVFGGYTNVSSFSLTDPLGPARGASGQVRLTPEEYQALVRGIDESGFREPSPKGLRLESWDFYWIVAGCVDGQFHFNAWLYPSERFATIKFDKWLIALDGTGVPPNPLRKLDSAEQRYLADYPRRRTYGGTGYTFELVVGENGLAGRLPPL
ncbi:MAG TPA: hypothetical protein VGB82_03880 [Alphaproteobacteria bacterium]